MLNVYPANNVRSALSCRPLIAFMLVCTVQILPFSRTRSRVLWCTQLILLSATRRRTEVSWRGAARSGSERRAHCLRIASVLCGGCGGCSCCSVRLVDADQMDGRLSAPEVTPHYCDTPVVFCWALRPTGRCACERNCALPPTPTPPHCSTASTSALLCSSLLWWEADVSEWVSEWESRAASLGEEFPVSFPNYSASPVAARPPAAAAALLHTHKRFTRAHSRLPAGGSWRHNRWRNSSGTHLCCVLSEFRLDAVTSPRFVWFSNDSILSYSSAPLPNSKS